MKLSHPLARVKGLGASGEGSHHWWVQRMSALALIPLTLWFLFSVVSVIGQDYQSVTAWVARPHVAIFLLIYLSAMFYHGMLGLQVIIEDYIHNESTRLISLLVMRAIMLLSGIAAVFAVLSISL